MRRIEELRFESPTVGRWSLYLLAPPAELATWKREGEDRYVAVTRELKDGEWRDAWRVDFRRAHPVSEGDWLD